ncbi:MAG: sulfur reduction protein DsrE [Dehalococcoidia bacterium]|nr:sulfur reduction protein DsrE [Dehalococcoidia bacterium]
MNVAYIFESPRAFDILATMIVPQLEENRHGATVAGMFFMFDNTYLIAKNNPLGQQINELAEKSGMLIMGCDQCCYQRNIAGNLISKASIGCFPDLYGALCNADIDQVITL